MICLIGELMSNISGSLNLRKRSFQVDAMKILIIILSCLAALIAWVAIIGLVAKAVDSLFWARSKSKKSNDLDNKN